MAEVSLVAKAGRPTGSPAARRLRAQGQVPAVLYGHGIEAQPISVDYRELRAALAQEAGINALFALDVDGTSHLAVARQVQRDPLRWTVSHVDFIIVRRDELIGAEVPVRLTGRAEAIERINGLVDQQLFALSIRATPANIPTAIEVDISSVDVGTVIRVGELDLPEGVTTDVDAEEPVVAGYAPRLLELEEEPEEGEVEEAPAEEGAEAAGEATAEE